MTGARGPGSMRAAIRGRARLAVALLAMAASADAQQADNATDAAALRASQAAIGRLTGDYPLVDEHGRAFRLGDLRGSPLVVSFVYTDCYAICSGQTLHLREVVRVAREALGSRGFNVLTVGFDTEHDTPPRMLAYRRDRGIVDPQWRFASADPATARRLADDIGFTWKELPQGFAHVAQVTVLDADGAVAHQVYGPEFAPPELVEPLKQLLLGRKIERTSVRGLIERVRLYCSVYDPSARRYRFDYSMLAGGIPAFMVLVIAVAALVVGRRAR